MSRKLKRILHVVEEKQAGVWRVIRVCDRKRDAEEFQLVQPDRRQIAVYERNEGTLRPGKCLWVIQMQTCPVLTYGLTWMVYDWQCTLLKARASIRAAKGPTRLLRFVRRKERNW